MQRRQFLRSTLALGAAAILPGVGLSASRLLGDTPTIVEPVSPSLNTSDVRDMLLGVVKEGKIDTIKSLIKQGFDVNTEIRCRRTLLHLAAGHRKVEIARFLISQGADVNAQADCGETPLHDAPVGASLETYQSRPLHDEAVKGYVAVAQLLISEGADVNAKDRFGYTPLHQAAKFAPAEYVKTLVSHGADANAKDLGGGTPLHDAVVNMNGEYAAVAKILILAGTDVNAKDNKGNVPLHWAASGGHMGVTRMLVNANAAVEAADNDNATPLHRAMCRGHLEVAEYLMGRGADPTGFTYEADVVLDTSEGLSVALTFDSRPWVSAQGKSWIGQRIREVAMAKNIPIHNAPTVECIADNGDIPPAGHADIASTCAYILHGKGLVYDSKENKFVKMGS